MPLKTSESENETSSCVPQYWLTVFHFYCLFVSVNYFFSFTEWRMKGKMMNYLQVSSVCTISFCQNLRRVPVCCVVWISCHETQCILSLHFIDWRQRNRQEHHYYLIKSSLSSQSIFFIPSSFLFSSSSSSLLFLSLDYHPVLLFHVSSREWRKKGCSRSDKMMILLLDGFVVVIVVCFPDDAFPSCVWKSCFLWEENRKQYTLWCTLRGRLE